MPRQSNRQPPSGNYSQAPKNLRNFAQGVNIVPQGIITDPQQNVHNVEHIIKYLYSDAFIRKLQGSLGDWIKGLIGDAVGAIEFPEGSTTEVSNNTTNNVENPFDPSEINNEITNIWNWINNFEPPEIPDYAVPGNGKLTFSVGGIKIGDDYFANQSNDTPINIELTEGGGGVDPDLVANVPWYVYCNNAPNAAYDIQTMPHNVRFLIFRGTTAANLTNVRVRTALNNRDFYVINRTNNSIALMITTPDGVNAISNPLNISGNTQGQGLRVICSDGYATNSLENFSFYGPGGATLPPPSVTLNSNGTITYA